MEADNHGVEHSVAVAVVMDYVGMTLAQYDSLIGELTRPPDHGLAQCLVHWCRRTMDGVRVTELWPSLDSYEFAWQNQIASVVRRLGYRAPEVTSYEVHHYLALGAHGSGHRITPQPDTTSSA
jgi:hypothetical protein